MKKIVRLSESELIFLVKKIVSESYTVNNTVGDFKIISDKRGHQTRKLGNWQSDNAWDLGGPVGTPVKSYTKGKVIKVFTSKPGDKIFGTQVTVKGQDGYPDIFYTHLDSVPVKVGQTVNVGDMIGKITNWEKHPEWTHVHIGLSDNYDLQDLIEKGVVSKPAKTPKSKINTTFDSMYDYKTENNKYFFKRKSKQNWVRARKQNIIDAIKKVFS
jgi:murein DD-endopeptidase MepM/ murein hydrolase activator NlpD